MSAEMRDDEPFFPFDGYDASSPASKALAASSHQWNRDAQLSFDFAYQGEASSTPADSLLQCSATDKGKGVSRPVPIRVLQRPERDMFDLCPSTSTLASSNFDDRFVGSSLTSSSSTFSTFQFPAGSADSSWRSSTPYDVSESMHTMIEQSALESGNGKGKAADLPPSLPPLNLHSISPSIDFMKAQPFVQPSVNVPDMLNVSQSHESASYSSCDSPTRRGTLAQGTINRALSRHRSLSELSMRSNHSTTTRSVSFVKEKLKASSNKSSLLARRLLSRNRDDAVSVARKWDALTEKETRFEACADLSAALVQAQSLPASPVNQTFPHSNRRTLSSPYPLSAIDIALCTSTDFIQPPALVPRNYFDSILPRELRLQVMHSLLDIHVEEHRVLMRSRHWTAAKAGSSKHKWVGIDKGVRELIKLSRVSRSWQAMIFDGQLWQNVDLRSFTSIPPSVVQRLISVVGPFVKSIDFSGQVHLGSSALLDIADYLCLSTSGVFLNQLTFIDLRGCTAITTSSLHHLLIRSPRLRQLNVKGLDVVTNTTCDILTTYCRELVSLNLSRCANMDSEGIHRLASAYVSRGEKLQLRELRLCGLKHVNDKMMAVLGRAAPHLEVLDLSYARQLHNSSIDAFVAWTDYMTEEEEEGIETIMVNAMDLGREDASVKYCRRVTKLRHLCLSSCMLLTDGACSNLAHSVPRLEFLELAGIGEDMQDDGLIRLLSTTPRIRRLDLEDASDITDSVIAAITPPPSSSSESDPTVPGRFLEHLTISHASRLTDAALLSLIRGCQYLTVLEADNTRISAAVLREFVEVCKQREAVDARIAVVDCRGIGETVVKELTHSTRPRLGWRTYGARKLKFLDGRDEVAEDLKIGQDECDEKRVVVKTFYSWQTVDAVNAVRLKRKKGNSRRAVNSSVETDSEDVKGTGKLSSVRWWSPGGRRSGSSSPQSLTEMNGSEGCTIM